MVNTLFFSKRNCLSVDLLTNIILNSILKARTRHQTSEDECRRVTDEFKQMQMSVDESLDQSRRVQTSHQTSVDESQTNVDECRMQTSHQTSADKCRRVTRRVQTNVDKCKQIKEVFFVSRKSDTWSHFAVVAVMQQYATSACKFSVLQFYL